MPANEPKILTQSISDLPFTEDFKSFSKKIGAFTVMEIITIPVKKLMQSEGFTYHALQELIKFLEEKDLAGLLKE